MTNIDVRDMTYIPATITTTTLIPTTNQYLIITELVKLDTATVVSAVQDILASYSDIGESDGELHPHQARVPDQGLGADGHQPVQGHQAAQSSQVGY